eukprot:6174464-Prymnesium_polylepis.1
MHAPRQRLEGFMLRGQVTASTSHIMHRLGTLAGVCSDPGNPLSLRRPCNHGSARTQQQWHARNRLRVRRRGVMHQQRALHSPSTPPHSAPPRTPQWRSTSTRRHGQLPDLDTGKVSVQHEWEAGEGVPAWAQGQGARARAGSAHHQPSRRRAHADNALVVREL